MTRVHVACEGPTELTFVREVLQSAFPRLHLIPYLPGRYVATRTGGRGGDIRYGRVWRDFPLVLKNDPACFCTTLFDYYALGSDFPACGETAGSDPHSKARLVEAAVDEDISGRMGPSFNPRRFRFHLVMHEFEGLLFSSPSGIARGLGRTDILPGLHAIRNAFPTPEHIDDHPVSAPSKRLLALSPGYDKVTGGNVVALEVGLDAMRRECPHFRGWLEWLESLPAM
jgi:hypothetical protein